MLYNTSLFTIWTYAARLLPISVCSVVGDGLGVILRRRSPEIHRNGVRAVTALRPDFSADGRAAEAAVRRLWSSLGRVYCELPVMERFIRGERVRIDDAAILDAAVDRGRPAIILFIHTGSWELSGMHLAMRYPHRILAVFSPLASAEETAFAMHARRSMPAAFAPMSRGVWRHALRHLGQRDALLWLAADEWDRGEVPTPSLGRRRRYDGNLGKAIRLARKTGAIIVPICSERFCGGRVRTHVLPPFDLVGGHETWGDREAVDYLDDLLGQYARLLADQWYMALFLGDLVGSGETDLPLIEVRR